jgi:hypothetical protein
MGAGKFQNGGLSRSATDPAICGDNRHNFERFASVCLTTNGQRHFGPVTRVANNGLTPTATAFAAAQRAPGPPCWHAVDGAEPDSKPGFRLPVAHPTSAAFFTLAHRSALYAFTLGKNATMAGDQSILPPWLAE